MLRIMPTVWFAAACGVLDLPSNCRMFALCAALVACAHFVPLWFALLSVVSAAGAPAESYLR